MELVSGRDGIEYGIGLLGWVSTVVLVGGGVGGVGWIVAGSGVGTAGRLLGGLLFLVGIVVVLSGMMGVLYKVIADAASRAE
jgi:hypothetical protein